jgi:hypothetical protein
MADFCEFRVKLPKMLPTQDLITFTPSQLKEDAKVLKLVVDARGGPAEAPLLMLVLPRRRRCLAKVRFAGNCARADRIMRPRRLRAVIGWQIL